MPQLTMEGIYQNGVIIPQEDVPYNSDMRVLITFTKKIPKREIYAHSPEIQKALAKAETNYKAGKFKEYTDPDALFKDLSNAE
ncbi:hypothetical protein KKG61_04795 [bacterium]|nr:hypothetical protein [bacterium]MBU1599407.1 hypothetical protein [bacterium]